MIDEGFCSAIRKVLTSLQATDLIVNGWIHSTVETVNDNGGENANQLVEKNLLRSEYLKSNDRRIFVRDHCVVHLVARN
jgi:hypothetical protein